MNSETQFLYKCAVTRSPNILSTSSHSKRRKVQTTQCVPSNTAMCWCGPPASLRHLLLFPNLQMLCTWLQQQGTHWYTTLRKHSHADLHVCLQLHFESLLRPMYLNLTPFLIYVTYFFWSIWRSTQTSSLTQARDTCCLALHPTVNKQNTT